MAENNLSLESFGMIIHLRKLGKIFHKKRNNYIENNYYQKKNAFSRCTESFFSLPSGLLMAFISFALNHFNWKFIGRVIFIYLPWGYYHFTQMESFQLISESSRVLETTFISYWWGTVQITLGPPQKPY